MRPFPVILFGGLLGLLAVLFSPAARESAEALIVAAGDRLRDLLHRLEGFSATPYQDVAGLWTIGYGHLIKPGDPYYPQGQIEEISQDEAAALYEADSEVARQCVRRAVRVPLTESQDVALVSFVYNVGCGAFNRSNVLARLNEGDYEGAAVNLADWNKARDPATGQLRVVKGLVNRRALEQEIFLS